MYPEIRKKNRYPYAALTEVTYGKKLAGFVTFLLDVTIFSAGIPNLIVGRYVKIVYLVRKTVEVVE